MVPVYDVYNGRRSVTGLSASGTWKILKKKIGGIIYLRTKNVDVVLETRMAEVRKKKKKRRQ